VVEVSAGTVTVFDGGDWAYIGSLGKNCAVTSYAIDFNGMVAEALPFITETEPAVPPVNVTQPIAVLGLTVAVTLAVCPVTSGGFNVVTVGVVG
jgi:hypothetical protein